MSVWIGTSGWQYRDWRAAFYPRRLPVARWLEHYSAAFRTVEVNATFYGLPRAEAVAEWAARTPADMVLACKVSSFLTHRKRLKDPAEPVERFLRVTEPLGDKRGPSLVQLPERFHADADRLDAALARFPRGVRVAVELRHDSWFRDDVRALLERRGAALVWADRGSRWVTPRWRTAGWGYLRFHHGAARPSPCYGRAALDSRAAAVAETFGRDADVYAYFNNDPRCCAVRDARLFALACSRHGLPHTRVPAAGEVEVQS